MRATTHRLMSANIRSIVTGMVERSSVERTNPNNRRTVPPPASQRAEYRCGAQSPIKTMLVKRIPTAIPFGSDRPRRKMMHPDTIAKGKKPVSMVPFKYNPRSLASRCMIVEQQAGSFRIECPWGRGVHWYLETCIAMAKPSGFRISIAPTGSAQCSSVYQGGLSVGNPCHLDQKPGQ